MRPPRPAHRVSAAPRSAPEAGSAAGSPALDPRRAADPLLRLMAAWLARQPLGPPATAETASRARTHRLGGWLWHLAEHHDLALPAASIPDLRGDWAAHFAGHLRRAERFAEWWPEAAPAPLVFKGADHAEALYGDPGARAAADLDLLVPAAALDGLVARLRARGARVVVPRYERFAHEPPYNLGLQLDGLLIELHRAAQPPHRGEVLADDLIARATPRTLGGRPALAPSDADRVLLWVANQAKDGFAGDLASQLDLALALRRLDPTDAPILWHRLIRAQLAPAFALALRRLQRLGLAQGLALGAGSDANAPWGPRAPLRLRSACTEWLLPDPVTRVPEKVLRYQLARLATATPRAALATALRWPSRLRAALMSAVDENES